MDFSSYPIRLDIALVERNLAKSRTHAKKLITESKVSVTQNGIAVLPLKPSTLIEHDALIQTIKHQEDAYVSRAGLKLEYALKEAGINVSGMVCLDVGQSTGGFTDCLLQHGAKHVTGIEVGHGQLVQTLKEDKRVVCIEGCNARYLTKSDLENSEYSLFDVIVMDVAFISQTLILPNLAHLLHPNGKIITLVKPQFEVGKAGIGKGGIVKNPQQYEEVKNKILDCMSSNNLTLSHYMHSPIEGGDGNKEFLSISKFNS